MVDKTKEELISVFQEYVTIKKRIEDACNNISIRDIMENSNLEFKMEINGFKRTYDMSPIGSNFDKSSVKYGDIYISRADIDFCKHIEDKIMKL